MPFQPARADWRLAFAAACLGGVGAAVFLVIDAVFGVGVRPAEFAVRSVHLLIFLVAAIVLWRGRDHATHRQCMIAALAMWLPFFPSLWLSEETAALAGRTWQPFVGHKVLFFCTAALFPSRPTWGSVAMIGGLGLHALLLWWHLDLGAAAMPGDEPWATIAYMGIACVLFGYRVHHGRTELELARVRAEAHALALTTEAFLVVHDLANTPLQVLELAIGLLRRRHGNDQALIDSASHAIARLRTIRDQLPVAQVTSASLDPEALDRLRQALLRAPER